VKWPCCENPGAPRAGDCHFLGNCIFASYDAIVDACCDAWNALIELPDRIR